MSYSYSFQRGGTEVLEKYFLGCEFNKVFDKDYDIIFTSEEAIYNLESLLTELNLFLENKNPIIKEFHSFDYKTKKIIFNEGIYFFKELKYGISIYIDRQSTKYNKPYIDEDKEDELEAGQFFVTFEVVCLLDGKANAIEFINRFFSKGILKTKKNRELNIISREEYGLELQPFKTNKVDINIDTHYNDDFKEVSEVVIEKLNEKNSKGIVLFSGHPGTGKTTFLRHLTQEIKDKKLIYVPPDMSAEITDPSFISFMLKYKNSVLIIEDAENILKTRNAGGNQAISNLLNLSDGLLGDALKLQIICTFNCETEKIDEALTREGRLIAEYKFEKLTIEKSNNLLKTLYKDDTIIQNKELSLAEIYNYKTKKIKTKDTKVTIGFNK